METRKHEADGAASIKNKETYPLYSHALKLNPSKKNKSRSSERNVLTKEEVLRRGGVKNKQPSRNSSEIASLPLTVKVNEEDMKI